MYHATKADLVGINEYQKEWIELQLGLFFFFASFTNPIMERSGYMITFLILAILAIIALLLLGTGSIFLIVLGADLIVCIVIIWKIATRHKQKK